MGKCEQCGGNEVIIIDPDQPVPCWCVMRMLQEERALVNELQASLRYLTEIFNLNGSDKD